MSRIVYVNGAWLPEEEAKISVFDRGFLFADGVYEVTSVLDGRLVDFAGHLARLHRSLGALEMPAPADDDDAPGDPPRARRAQRPRRGHGLPAGDPRRRRPRLRLAGGAGALASCSSPRPAPLVDTAAARNGIKVIAVPDIRWARRDIKTVQLLAPSMGKMAAKKAGCDDAWLVEDGFVTEGTSNNAYIVTRDGAIVTRDLSNAILHGITRAAVLRLAARGAAAGRGTGLHRRRGDGRRRGLRHRRLGLRHPGGRDRRPAARRRRARAGDAAAARDLPRRGPPDGDLERDEDSRTRGAGVDMGRAFSRAKCR